MADARSEYIQVGSTVKDMERLERETRDAELQARKHADEVERQKQASADEQRRQEQAREEGLRQKAIADKRAEVLAAARQAAQYAANLQPYLAAAKPLVDDLAVSRDRLQAGDISLESYRQLADGIADKYARLPAAPSDDQSKTLSLLLDTDKKQSDGIVDFWNTYVEYKARDEPVVWIDARRSRDDTVPRHITSVDNTIDLYNKMVQQVNDALAAVKANESYSSVQASAASQFKTLPDTVPPSGTDLNGTDPPKVPQTNPFSQLLGKWRLDPQWTINVSSNGNGYQLDEVWQGKQTQSKGWKAIGNSLLFRWGKDVFVIEPSTFGPPEIRQYHNVAKDVFDRGKALPTTADSTYTAQKSE